MVVGTGAEAKFGERVVVHYEVSYLSMRHCNNCWHCTSALQMPIYN